VAGGPLTGSETERAMQLALKLLARRSWATSELGARLGRAGFDSETTEAVVSRLKDLGLLNDHEYARVRVANSLASGRASAGVREELAIRGVETGVIDSALEEAEEAEEAEEVEEVEEGEGDYGRAMQLAHKRARAASHLPPAKNLQRVYRYLAQQGYDADMSESVCLALFGDLAMVSGGEAEEKGWLRPQ
jgi:regulatory protein